MSSLDGIDDFKFRVRRYPPDDPRPGGHELHIELVATGQDKISSRSIISDDIPPDLSALDWLIRRAADSLKQFIREERER